jgi:hypothetical protein
MVHNKSLVLTKIGLFTSGPTKTGFWSFKFRWIRSLCEREYNRWERVVGCKQTWLTLLPEVAERGANYVMQKYSLHTHTHFGCQATNAKRYSKPKRNFSNKLLSVLLRVADFDENTKSRRGTRSRRKIYTDLVNHRETIVSSSEQLTMDVSLTTQRNTERRHKHPSPSTSNNTTWLISPVVFHEVEEK